MPKPNSFHWNMTQSTDDRVVYLCVMRNLREYCKKGYCDFFLAAYRFSDYPPTLALRMLKPYRNMQPFKFSWEDHQSRYDFVLQFIMMLARVYHSRFNRNAFDLAYEEFNQRFRNNDKETNSHN